MIRMTMGVGTPDRHEEGMTIDAEMIVTQIEGRHAIQSTPAASCSDHGWSLRTNHPNSHTLAFDNIYDRPGTIYRGVNFLRRLYLEACQAAICKLARPFPAREGSTMSSDIPNGCEETIARIGEYCRRNLFQILAALREVLTDE